MPSLKANYHGMSRRFDARPDRYDIRDRIYQPKLVNLPNVFPSPAAVKTLFTSYAKSLVLNQGTEGACTGFGLAALVNFLNFKDAMVEDYAAGKLRQGVQIPLSVSPRMLYEHARLYDEWPGEDYEGSSCRGAMKGWHRHGVCDEITWPYLNKQGGAGRPLPGWERKAAAHPLGSYYRIETDDIAALQSAILEVGAVFASAEVHKGWNLGPTAKAKSGLLPAIPWRSSYKVDGGHAFAFVGFNADGFIVQNSWGSDWGYHGFALLSYEDWLNHASDAWVATRGVPRPAIPVPMNFSSSSLPQLTGHTRSSAASAPAGVTVWSEDEARKHCLVIGNDGAVMRGSAAHTPATFVSELLIGELRTWMATKKTHRKIAIYAHGGLNDEAAGIKRARVMGPALLANDIYPIFIVWKTGWKESLLNMGEDVLRKLLPPGMEDRGPAGSIFDKIREKVSDGWDYTVENSLGWLGKSLWSQMKQNAGAAGGPTEAAGLLAQGLHGLAGAFPNAEIHLIGHSAGTIWHGHFLTVLRATRPAGKVITTCQMFAAACTVRFANDHYAAAIVAGSLSAAKCRCYHLTDAAECVDTVGGIYRKSLLYFVSRACEDHKTPILGMEAAWNAALDKRDIFNRGNPAFAADLKTWRGHVSQLGIPAPVTVDTKDNFFDGKKNKQPNHGGFDNDLVTINAAIRFILAGPPPKPVTWLSDL